MDFFNPVVTEQQVKTEKQKARDMRKTQWWKQKCAEGCCYYCGQESLAAELTMDHVVPIIRGGRSAKNNLVPCCKECNSKKKYMLPSEWHEYLERIKGEEAG